MPRLTAGPADAPTHAAPDAAPAEGRRPDVPADLACEVAGVLAAMTLAERTSAYRCCVFSPRELAIAAARLPDEMPLLNGEYEWLAHDLE